MLLLHLFFGVAVLQAQETDTTESVSGNIEVEEEPILNPLDDLLTEWMKSNLKPNLNREEMNIYGFKEEDIPVYPDSVYEYRLSLIETPIPMTFNSAVKSFIDLYALRRRDNVQAMLGLAHYYFPLFEETLDKYDLPLEFKYLPVIESALNPKAVSRAGATGSWQFMYSTGKMYGLQVTSYVDERRDPYMATDAAARFIKDLYKIYGNYLYVIAAYNCGPGNVNKAIRRSGGKTDFWEIYPYLPRETRGYVPAFIAATYVFTYHREHNLYPLEVTMPLAVDTVVIENEVNFEKIAEVLNVDIEIIRDLNPHYKKDVIPARAEPYLLRLPMKSCLAFCDFQDSIYALDALPVVAAPAGSAAVSLVQNQTNSNTTASSENTKLYYTVKSGDNLGYIAEWYDVSASDLRRWNGISGNTIRPGQKLQVYVKTSQSEKYKKVEHLTFAQKQRAEHKYQAAASSSTSGNEVQYYIIKNGDTLWEIARKYPGVSAEDIKRSNNIHNIKSLKPGQKLKIEISS